MPNVLIIYTQIYVRMFQSTVYTSGYKWFQGKQGARTH